MGEKAKTAIVGARLVRTTGFWAAWRYCQKRGVPPGLFTLARVLEAAQQAERRNGGEVPQGRGVTPREGQARQAGFACQQEGRLWNR